MASTSLVPVEEYLSHIDQKPAYEYIDGVLIEKPMGTFLHGALQASFGYLFRRYPKYIVASEIHSRLRTTEYRLPDVAVQLRSIVLTETYAVTPLVLAIEILSPEDKLGAMFTKCESYHKWGVPFCWVFDPEKRRAWSYAKDGEPRLAEEKIEAGEISFTLAEIFEGLDPQF